MNKKEEAKLGMYNAVISYCNNNMVIVNTLQPFAVALTALKAKRDAIVVSTQQEMQTISGIAAEKAVLKEKACELTGTIAALVFAYAAVTNNLILKEQTDYTAKSLARINDDKIAPVCKNVTASAQSCLASLASYGVTQAMIMAANSAIDEYSASVATPRNAVSQRSAYGAALDQLFKDADKILKEQMDKLLVPFRNSHPDFYTTYQNNRIIVDAGSTTTKIKGTVTNAADNSAVQGATITVVGSAVSVLTDVQGKFSIPLKPGNYALQITKDTSAKTLNNLLVKLGKETVADASL